MTILGKPVLWWARLGVELVVDAVTGGLERREPPGKALPHTHVEHIRRSTHGHMFLLGAGSVWCRGPDAPHAQCPRCVPRRPN